MPRLHGDRLCPDSRCLNIRMIQVRKRRRRTNESNDVGAFKFACARAKYMSEKKTCNFWPRFPKLHIDPWPISLWAIPSLDRGTAQTEFESLIYANWSRMMARPGTSRGYLERATDLPNKGFAEPLPSTIASESFLPTSWALTSSTYVKRWKLCEFFISRTSLPDMKSRYL